MGKGITVSCITRTAVIEEQGKQASASMLNTP